MSIKELKKLEKEYRDLGEKISVARRKINAEPVSAYSFVTASGDTSLADLFGSRDELILIHNMGRGCPYCTLWADGFNGMTGHFENLAAFVVVSPDSPEAQAEFAESRGWKFQMVTYSEDNFAEDMGYRSESGGYGPGVSAFRKNADGSIVRTGTASFGPGDMYCSIWPMMQLLGKGYGDWKPEYQY